MTSIRAGLKLLGVFALIIWIIVIQTPLLMITRGPKSYFFTRLYHAGICKVLGLKLDVVGAPVRAAERQTLYVCNHLSYMDISAVGSLIRQASFIAKKDVRTMPLYGYLSTMQQTAFISRERKDAARERNALETMAAEGRSLILFPEGTSTTGVSVLPFKSSLFGIVLQDAVKERMAVQPMTISLLDVDGQPVRGVEDREKYAWTTDMSDDLTAHLWGFLKTSGARLRIEFHDPVMAGDFTDRKALALAMHEKTAGGLVLPEQTLDSHPKAA